VAELNDRLALSRADKAKALLESEEFKNAFEAVKTSILERIESCPIRDTEGLHDLHLMLKLLKDVKANIESVINTGKVVQDRLSYLERIKKVAYGKR
jgi:hypothetical protein